MGQHLRCSVVRSKRGPAFFWWVELKGNPSHKKEKRAESTGQLGPSMSKTPPCRDFGLALHSQSAEHSGSAMTAGRSQEVVVRVEADAKCLKPQRPPDPGKARREPPQKVFLEGF